MQDAGQFNERLNLASCECRTKCGRKAKPRPAGPTATSVSEKIMNGGVCSQSIYGFPRLKL
jgi:hypothetical protein